MPHTHRLVSALAAGAPASGLIISPAAAASAKLPDQLVRKVTVSGVNRHLIALQRIADTNNGIRAASTEGHKKSAEYVASKLESAGFTVTRQEFPFTFTQTLAQKLTVAGATVPVVIMDYSPSTPVGGISASLAVIPAGSDATPGCEPDDYTGAGVTGKIAMIKRGGCTFVQKQQTAAAAGAVAALIYNNVDGALNGTLGSADDATIPTGGLSQSDGEALAAAGSGAAATLELRALIEDRTTYNVIAETKTGRHDNVVMAGAHLDSVTEGPGINDNGSGSAGLLETALQLGSKPKIKNAVRFAWWSAEEFGLLGSNYYVNSLSFDSQLDIALYMNFDMIGSPNAAYFVYDGDDSDQVGSGPGPYGSARVEQVLAGYLSKIGVPTEGTDFDGRSDYGGFIGAGIPAGGLFTGAEEIKTPEQAAKWGGTAGVAFDACYHQACDNLGNVDRTALGRNSDALAYAVGTFALSTESVNGVPAGSATVARAASTQRSVARTAAPRPMEAAGSPAR